MRVTAKSVSGALACLAAGVASAAFAGDKVPPNDAPAPAATARPDGDKILSAETFRTSKLVGMNVRNVQGEYLGTIDDLVIDVRTGKVQYAALSVGGILGLGNRLFAVPFGEFKFDHGQDEMFFVLNMAKEKLAAAPGFDKNDWPDFADATWRAKVDEHYRKTAATRENQTEQRTGERDEARPD